VYATIIEPMISYWTIRETARNIDSGKTASLASLLFSLIGVIIYLISAYYVGLKTDADQNIVLLGSIMVPLIFLNRVLTSISFGWKPQGMSYGQILFGITQIPVGLLFVYFFQLGTPGVIYTVSIAYVVSIVFFIIYNKKKLSGKIKKDYLKKMVEIILDSIISCPWRNNFVFRCDDLLCNY